MSIKEIELLKKELELYRPKAQNPNMPTAL